MLLIAGSLVPFWSLVVRFSAFLPMLSKKSSKAAPSGFGSSAVWVAIFVDCVLENARWDVVEGLLNIFAMTAHKAVQLAGIEGSSARLKGRLWNAKVVERWGENEEENNILDIFERNDGTRQSKKVFGSS